METSFMYGGANMAVCIECGKEFDVAAVRRKLSREYYKGCLLYTSDAADE